MLPRPPRKKEDKGYEDDREHMSRFTTCRTQDPATVMQSPPKCPSLALGCPGPHHRYARSTAKRGEGDVLRSTNVK